MINKNYCKLYFIAPENQQKILKFLICIKYPFIEYSVCTKLFDCNIIFISRCGRRWFWPHFFIPSSSFKMYVVYKEHSPFIFLYCSTLYWVLLVLDLNHRTLILRPNSIFVYDLESWNLIHLANFALDIFIWSHKMHSYLYQKCCLCIFCKALLILLCL